MTLKAYLPTRTLITKKMEAQEAVLELCLHPSSPTMFHNNGFQVLFSSAPLNPVFAEASRHRVIVAESPSFTNPLDLRGIFTERILNTPGMTIARNGIGVRAERFSTI